MRLLYILKDYMVFIYKKILFGVVVYDCCIMNTHNAHSPKNVTIKKVSVTTTISPAVSIFYSSLFLFFLSVC